MKKYKCLDCGHQFEGDISTTECPQCGCSNIKPIGGNLPKLVWKIIGAAALLLLIIILLTKCEGCSGGKNIFMTLDTSSKEWLKISTQDITPANLKALYKIEITNDSTSQKDYQFFDGKGDFTTYSTRDLIAGVTYHFFLVDKKTGIQPENVRWNTNNSYTMPLPPVQPEIAISKVSDCNTKTYTITINVTKGNADMFYLGDNSQTSNVFTDVPDGSTYVVKAYDTSNNLYSEEHRVECAIIEEFHITEAQIQEALNGVANGLLVADALKIINHGENIKLAKIIDGNTNLEAALNVSYAQGKQYYVHAVIESNDCSDIIRSITLSSSK